MSVLFNSVQFISVAVYGLTLLLWLVGCLLSDVGLEVILRVARWLRPEN